MSFDPRVTLTPEPGIGPGWTRVAEAVAARLHPDEIEGIWLFAPVRREEREWGVAVISCRTDDMRLRIYTAGYMMIVRGREKGHGKVSVDEVGESPMTVLEDVIRGVQDRAGDSEPPVEILPSLWFSDSPSDLDQQES